jgi:hypothetical protein
MTAATRVVLTSILVVAACGSSPSGTIPPDGAAPTGDAAEPGADKPAPAADTAAPAGNEAGAVGGAPPDATLAADISAPPTPDATAATCGVCAAYGAAQMVGQVQDPQLNAVSGIAASWRNPGLLYVHNDRDRAEFAAVAESGLMVGRFTVTGAALRDVEDIAVGRCPAGTCVHLADLGNNVTPRTEFQILRVAEPMIAGMGASATLAGERLAFTYPDGPHNAESLLIDPGSGALYVITKVAAGARSTVYKLPPFPGGAATKVADLPVPAAGDQPATAADAHPCGAGFLLRTNNTAYEFRIPMGTPFEDAFKATPMVVPVGVEQQSEAIAYRPDGRGYYTTSEGARPPIHRVGCK